MADDNFNADVKKGNNGEEFVAKHFREITGVEIPAGAEAHLITPQGYNAGNDVGYVWYTKASGEVEIVDGEKDGEPMYRKAYGQIIHSCFDYAVEVKADCGKFLSRNTIDPDYKLVLNAPCGSLGFEAYKERSHKPGSMFEYMTGLKLDGSGGSIREPKMIVFTLYLSGNAKGDPFACVAIPWSMKTNDRLQWYISQNKSWVIEEDVAAGTVTISPPCGSTRDDGLAWQGSTRGEGFNMIHIPMTEILKHMDGEIIMVGEPLTDAELFKTEGFKSCVKYYGHGDYSTAEKLVKHRYNFLQAHAAGQINL